MSGGAQITMMLLMGANLGLGLALHGKPRTGKHDAGITLFATVVQYVILWWGGFWR